MCSRDPSIPKSFGRDCSVDGLYLCGQSTLSHGFSAAAYSGLLAATRALGVRRPEELLAKTETPLRVYPAEQHELWMSRARDTERLARAPARTTEATYPGPTRRAREQLMRAPHDTRSCRRDSPTLARMK